MKERPPWLRVSHDDSFTLTSWLSPCIFSCHCKPFVERSFAPAVQLPVGGQSYNPAYEEHQALLAKALEFETALEEEKRRHAAGTPRPMGWLKTQEALMRELTEGVLSDSRIHVSIWKREIWS